MVGPDSENISPSVRLGKLDADHPHADIHERLPEAGNQQLLGACPEYRILSYKKVLPAAIYRNPECIQPCRTTGELFFFESACHEGFSFHASPSNHACELLKAVPSVALAPPQKPETRD